MRRQLPRKSGRTTVLSALLVLATLLLTPAASAASADRHSFADRVDLAGAVWITETDISFSDLTISIFNLSERSTLSGPINYKDPGIVLFYFLREVHPTTGAVTETHYEAFSGGPDSNFRFSPSFEGATATFTLSLYGYQCVYQPQDPGEPQGIADSDPICEELDRESVSGDIHWTGTGPIFRDVSHTRFGEPPLYMFGTKTVFAARDASVLGTIQGNGLDLAQGHATFGTLLRGKYHEHFVSPRPDR